MAIYLHLNWLFYAQMVSIGFGSSTNPYHRIEEFELETIQVVRWRPSMAMRVLWHLPLTSLRLQQLWITMDVHASASTYCLLPNVCWAGESSWIWLKPEPPLFGEILLQGMKFRPFVTVKVLCHPSPICDMSPSAMGDNGYSCIRLNSLSGISIKSKPPS
mgnify:CR=1 FL=1